MRPALLAVIVAVAVASTAAHEKFKIVGTIAALKQDEIAIKSIDGSTYEIDMNEKTAVMDRNRNKLSRADLRIGVKATVMALGHDQFDLEAFEIQLTDR
jgi:hypothetical protein